MFNLVGIHSLANVARNDTRSAQQRRHHHHHSPPRPQNHVPPHPSMPRWRASVVCEKTLVSPAEKALVEKPPISSAWWLPRRHNVQDRRALAREPGPIARVRHRKPKNHCGPRTLRKITCQSLVSRAAGLFRVATSLVQARWRRWASAKERSREMDVRASESARARPLAGLSGKALRSI